ncbi:FTR1 family iron permease [Sulfurivermis fontis]|uniref:FTR1 family iron permease n=1 Tax=Sulfurivermis fontis TaxID=1972068 RepID=UPI000FD8C6EF|nr:FTR1 family protein [Sulfurivermis fontis]
MGQALFIVWRESIEALLVIGILWAWLRMRGELARGRWYLAAGAAAGLLLAGALAVAMTVVQDELAGAVLEYFQAGMVLLAAALITHMVLWMRRHGRAMRQQLHAGAAAAFDRAGAFGIAVLVAIAVAREGAETAIFLYGLSFNAGSELWQGAVLGVVLALLTVMVLARGLRLFSYAVFFRASSVLLLLLACGLLVSGVERLIGLEMLPALVDPLWDSTFLLDDAAGPGNVLATFAGYRARPSLVLLLLVAAYWLFVLWPRHPASATVRAHD